MVRSGGNIAGFKSSDIGQTHSMLMREVFDTNLSDLVESPGGLKGLRRINPLVVVSPKRPVGLFCLDPIR